MRRSSNAFITALVIIVASLAVAAQEPAQQPQRGGRGGRGGGQPPAEPGAPAALAASTAKPLIPVAASTLANNPDPYYGENVTLTGAVEQKLNTLAFSVDQDKTKSTGKEVLILAPRLNAPVDANTYVTVIGEVVKFDPAEV